MREPQCKTLLPLLLIFLFAVQAANAQAGPTSLQIGTPIERTLAAGQSHSYNITLEADQFLELVVDQRGIDVVVRAFSPTGRRLREVDTPNGTDGPEDVTVIAQTAGVYRIEVSPLDPSPPPGRYEIKIVELRKATEQELQAGKNQEVVKAKGLALLIEATQNFPQLRRPQTRATFQIQAAQLLWDSDDKRASKLMDQAIDSVKEFISNIDNNELEYYESFEIAMQLREQLIEALAPHDPEMALNFLRATRTLANPEGAQARAMGDRELQLELSLASQITSSDPKRAFQMAEEALKKGASPSLADTLNRLREKDPELAAKLAHDIAAKITNERLLKNPDAAYLAASFLRIVRSPAKPQMGDGEGAANTSLISEDEFRDLFQKVLSEVLSYSPPAINSYTSERNIAQNLLSTLKQMSADLQRYAPDRAAALEKKWRELNNLNDPQGELRERFQTAINNGTPDAALESVDQAPREMRDQLYQQAATRIAAAGDVTRARQIITDHLTNPMQRQQALRMLDQQAIYGAAAKGKIDEALRSLSNFRPLSERAQILSQIATRIGPGLKTSTALMYLQQARNMLGPSAQAEDQQQMYALLAIARAFSKYDSTRAFEIVEPLVDQFNDLSAAALTLNGFGQKFYQDGELLTHNGNAVTETAKPLAQTLGTLALVNFERARAAADRIHSLDVRMNIYLTIAQQAILPVKSADMQ
ncbi:MAG: hypothetical protein QOE96_309 [Blastocatellia bacterium]|jgi:hypothetical protein|nr:hypothetical protein [Blastocatellia bacterium]